MLVVVCGEVLYDVEVVLFVLWGGNDDVGWFVFFESCVVRVCVDKDGFGDGFVVVIGLVLISRLGWMW